MNSMQILNVTYQKWKDMRTFLGGTSNSYYIQSSEGYILVVVDLSKKVVTISHLRFGNAQGESNMTDFETNLKSTSISETTIDDCIAAAIIG